MANRSNDIIQNKSKYKTRQRAELIAYLSSMSGEHVTVSDICRHFEKNDRPIGVTTVYRQLDKLVEEGLVNKYTLDSGSSACYEYIGEENTEHCNPSCYHCKCDGCGRLIHLHCGEIEELIEHIGKSHNFLVNPRRTVLYGLCDECRRKAEKDM